MYAFHLAASIMFLIAALGNLFSEKGNFIAFIIDLGFAIWGFATLPH